MSHLLLGFCREWNALPGTPAPDGLLYTVVSTKCNITGWGADLQSAYDHFIKNYELNLKNNSLTMKTRFNLKDLPLEYMLVPDNIIRNLHKNEEFTILFRDLTKVV